MKNRTSLETCVLLVIKVSLKCYFDIYYKEEKSPTFAKRCHVSVGGILFVCQHTSKHQNYRLEGGVTVWDNTERF